MVFTAAGQEVMPCLLAEVRLFAGDFAPRKWALADGRLLSIGAAQALFSLLGTTYGGDGQTTFALPNLSGLPVNYIICISGDFPQA